MSFFPESKKILLEERHRGWLVLNKRDREIFKHLNLDEKHLLSEWNFDLCSSIVSHYTDEELDLAIRLSEIGTKFTDAFAKAMELEREKRDFELVILY